MGTFTKQSSGVQCVFSSGCKRTKSFACEMLWCGNAVCRVSTPATAAERLETNLFGSKVLGLAMESSSQWAAGSGSGATCSLDLVSAMLASLVWAIASGPPVAGFQEIRCRLEAREIHAPTQPCEDGLRRRDQGGGFSASRRLHAGPDHSPAPASRRCDGHSRAAMRSIPHTPCVSRYGWRPQPLQDRARRPARLWLDVS